MDHLHVLLYLLSSMSARLKLHKAAEADLMTHCNKIPFSPCYSKQSHACWFPYKPVQLTNLTQD